MARVTRPGGVVAACVWDFAAGCTLLGIFWESVRARARCRAPRRARSTRHGLERALARHRARRRRVDGARQVSSRYETSTSSGARSCSASGRCGPVRAASGQPSRGLPGERVSSRPRWPSRVPICRRRVSARALRCSCWPVRVAAIVFAAPAGTCSAAVPVRAAGLRLRPAARPALGTGERLDRARRSTRSRSAPVPTSETGTSSSRSTNST